MCLFFYLSENTLCTLITAYQTMLPSSLKVKRQKSNYDLYDEYVYIKDKNKENVITVFIENNKRDITIKNDIKSLRTIIGILFA